MVAVRELGRDRLEQPRTLGVRNAEGEKLGTHAAGSSHFLLPYCGVHLSMYFAKRKP